jgi:hypothetical protein
MAIYNRVIAVLAELQASHYSLLFLSRPPFAFVSHNGGMVSVLVEVEGVEIHQPGEWEGEGASERAMGGGMGKRERQNLELREVSMKLLDNFGMMYRNVKCHMNRCAQMYRRAHIHECTLTHTSPSACNGRTHEAVRRTHTGNLAE